MVIVLSVLLLAAASGLAGAGFHLVRLTRTLREQEAAVTALQSARQLDVFRITRRDTLTQLAARQSFVETLSAAFARNGRFALLVIDVDNFDRLNANLGYAAADELLQALATRLQALAERDQAARLNGDRFAVLLTRPEDLDDVPAAAARISASLTAPYCAAGQLIDAGVSIGAALAPLHGANADALLRAARSALVLAKQQGGGRVVFCDTVQAQDVLTRQQTRQELQRAIEAGEIVPYYQPVVRLPGAEIAKFEVLARWIHPQRGVLLPEDFIPVADEMGLSGQISMSLLRQVAADTQDWPDWCRYAINISPGQVRELIGLLCAQPGAWQRRMDFSRLEVEISEASLTQDRALARELIDVLHEKGARAVLDDFGSSANLFHLRDMPFDAIKICKTFVQTLEVDPRAEACVLSMLWLGQTLKIDIVADGVETAEVAERLAALGCTFAQGFLYARPGAADAACKLLGIERALEAA